jgi:ribose transport system permease protein
MMQSKTTSTPRSLFAQLKKYLGLISAIVVLVIVFGCLSKNFWSVASAASIINSIPDLLLVSVGMTLVLIVGGIDLSVGSVLALGATVTAILAVDFNLPIALSAILGITISTLCGLINGFISFRFTIPSFIVTLGMLEIARGMAYQLSDSQTKFIGSSLDWISEPMAGTVVSPAFAGALLVVILVQGLLAFTVLGRLTIAIGTNTEAVRMSGISPLKYCVTIFGICGLLCGLAGLVQVSRLATADPNAGIGMELSAIAACVIGGTSLRGGKGSAINTFFGVLIIAILQSGLAQVGVSDPMKRVVTGLVIVIAVLADAWREKRF